MEAQTTTTTCVAVLYAKCPASGAIQDLQISFLSVNKIAITSAIGGSNFTTLNNAISQAQAELCEAAITSIINYLITVVAILCGL